MKKLTNQDRQDLIKFNTKRKKSREPPLTEKQYLDYLYGKGLPVSNSVKFKPLQVQRVIPKDRDPYQYKSYVETGSIDCHRPTLSKEEKVEICKQYTIAPVCNKGGYQVIRKEEITTMGRKV